MKVVLEKDIRYEDNNINGIEFLIKDDCVFVQIGSAYIRMERDEIERVFRLLA
jgi:hypothetical protein